jgi:16S rRNA (adenine1518-N6/adenine1519-N6)-dimethyltransferase
LASSGGRSAYSADGERHLARKRFGQHFLTDGAVIDAIVDAIGPKPGEALLEIGPGLGAMTDPLVARCGALTVIELDRDLAQRLRRRSELTVIEADVLTVDFGALARLLGQRVRVVGNLPYNISTPILFHLLGAVGHVVDQHFMLQKEVVERMAAAPGSKDYGRLSVMLQWRYDIESVLDVSPQAFSPPPRVDSAVVRMRPLAVVPTLDPAVLTELVRVAFSQRRKLLRHTLGRWLDEQRFNGEFELQRRAEEVPVSEYLALAAAVGGLRALGTEPASITDGGAG